MSLLDVARAGSLGKHLSPQEVCPGGEELRIRSFTRCSGVGKVGICLVVTAENSSETTEGVTHQT